MVEQKQALEKAQEKAEGPLSMTAVTFCCGSSFFNFKRLLIDALIC